MSKFNPKVDEFIAKSRDFAKPILEHLRQLVHDNCPEVEEKMKWSMPFFDYKGEMMCHMASFKQHCAFGFWKASLMKDATLLAVAQSEQAMGHLGKITSLADLPPDAKLASYIKEAMALNENGVKIKKPKTETKKEISVPSDFMDKLENNPLAIEYFEKSSYSFKKEYVVWIEEAKTEATRLKRMSQAIEWIAEGKGRNWKY
ncbi:MAG: DUF1801 domain-containing protein [Bacteroidota bacterium]